MFCAISLHLRLLLKSGDRSVAYLHPLAFIGECVSGDHDVPVLHLPSLVESYIYFWVVFLVESK